MHNHTPVSGRTGAIIFSLLFTLVGGVFWVVGVFLRAEFQQSKTWPSVPGEVVDAYVASDSSDGSTSYAPVVVYQYVVDDYKYQGNRLDLFSTSYSSSSAAQEQVRPYRTGTRVIVYYDPQDPANAMLNTGGTDWFSLIFIGLGSLFLVIGLAAGIATITGRLSF